MHVAAKIGLTVAGGAVAGLALGRYVDQVGNGPGASTGSNLAGLAVGAGTIATFASLMARSTAKSSMPLVGVGMGAVLAGMSIAGLFDGSPAKSGARNLAPGPIPSPSPGPAPTPHPTDELAGREHELVDPLRPDAGPVEAEVETYGPDGEYLGNEHGTLGG